MIPLGIQKKEKKINAFFSQVSNSVLLSRTLTFYKRERVPDPTGVGRP